MTTLDPVAIEPASAAPVIADAPLAPSGVGDRLRAARESRGLSLADVSQALKFSVRQIELVEGNAWPELPGQTFIRGCVSNYARFLQIDPGPILKELESANMPKAPVLDLPGSTNATLPTPGRSPARDLAAVVVGLLLVGIAVVAYFFVPDDFWKLGGGKVESTSAPSPGPAIARPATLEPAPAVAAANVPTPVSPVGGSGASIAPATDPASTFPRVDPAAPGATVLRFEFEQASWVEVRDSSGALLHSQNNAAGTVQEVSGIIPLAVVVGDARRVRMIYRDKPVDLAPFTNPQSNVARLNIE